MQKKIGILTFHNSVNYGAVLQAFALQHFLEINNYNVSIIDYINNNIESKLNEKIRLDKNNFFGLIKIAIKKIYRIRKNRKFNIFIKKYLNLSKKRKIRSNDINKINNNFDTIISGSDQVWNLNLTNNDLIYFLNFTNKNIKKIAYAVSVGDYKNCNLDIALNDIKKFNAISVRESFLQKNINKQYCINSDLCCDPTLLINSKTFENLSGTKTFLKEKYIFCFLMEEKEEILKIADMIAKEKGYKVINNKKSLKFFQHCGPIDFLVWIKNAEMILTDSFHGTIFSIIFKKNFLSDKYDKAMNKKIRIEDLLQQVGLKERLEDISINNYEIIFNLLNKSIDYDKIIFNIKNISKKSSLWLNNAIKK